MNVKRKRLLSMLMTLVMLVSLLPAVAIPALAVGDTITVDSSTINWTNGNTYVVSSDVTISSRINVSGSVTLQLDEGCTLTASRGIQVSSGNSLTIEGSGALTATGVSEAAGIGGKGGWSGEITVNGGTINATGGEYGAGIGGGRYGGNGLTTINGGVVTATGGWQGAGIGGGGNYFWRGSYGNGGNTVINGGVVNANGNKYGAGIGGGGANSTGVVEPGYGGSIVINGGQVTATSDEGFGIGPGSRSDGRTGGNGFISLDLTDPDAFIEVSSYRGTVIFNGVLLLDGTDTVATAENIAGQKLVARDTDPVKYTITWLDGNGNVLPYSASTSVTEGQTPVYGGDTPGKEQTVDTVFTFDGTWSPEIVPATGNATYTAQFSSAPRQYKIIWKDGDGNTLKDQNINYGTTPVYSGNTPTKSEDSTYYYRYNGTWSPEIVPVAGDATYTAQFDSIYGIAYSANGGSGSMDTVMLDPGVEVSLPECGFTAPENHVFDHWQIGEDSYAPGDRVTVSSKLSAVSVWRLVNYTVSFEAGDGSGEMADAIVDYGSAYVLPACSFTPPEGKEFYRWLLNGELLNVGAEITPTENLSLTAVWAVEGYRTFTLTFTAGEGEGNTFLQPAVESLEYKLPECPFTAPENKVFLGWTLDGDAAIYQPGAVYEPDGSVTFTAGWREYQVTFDADGGEGEMAVMTAENTEITLPECGFTRTGYSFAGWMLEDTVVGQPGETYAVSGDVTLKAKWDYNGPKVTFDFGDGRTIVYDVREGETTEYPASSITVWEGHDFLGWYASGANRPFDFTTPIYESMTLYAQWSCTTLTAISASSDGVNDNQNYHKLFDKKDGTNGSSGTKWCVGGFPGTAPLSVDFKADGYIRPTAYILVTGDDTSKYADRNPKDWLLYALDPDTDAWTLLDSVVNDTVLQSKNYTAYRFEITTTLNKDYKVFRFIVKSNKSTSESCFQMAELYLISNSKDTTAREFTVTYTPGEGTGDTATETVADGATITLGTPDYTSLYGYDFIGWLYNDKLYAAGSSVAIYSNATFVAQYQEPYTISFSANGGTGEMADVTVDAGGQYTVPECGFTREGYRFAGWYIAPNGYWDVGETINVDGDLTLIAQWVQVYTITLDPGELSEQDPIVIQTCDYGEYCELPEPDDEKVNFTAPEGYAFGGWQVNGYTYQPGYNYYVSRDVTFTAVWKQLYTVTMIPGDGSGETGYASVMEGEYFYLPFSEGFGEENEYELDWTAPADESLIFNGWAIVGLIGEEHIPGWRVRVIGDMTVKTVWRGENAWDRLTAEINTIAESESKTGSIVLTEDVVAATFGNDGFCIPAGVSVTIDLAGHVIDRCLYDEDGFTQDRSDSVFYVNGELTIEDSSEDETGVIRGGSDSGIYLYMESHGEIEVPDGPVVESVSAVPRGVDDGDDGDGGDGGDGGDDPIEEPIEEPIGEPEPGDEPFEPEGIPPVFILNGGTIAVNAGCGVYIDDGAVFIMNGGYIVDNYDNGYDGAGVYVEDYSYFEMNDGVISGNYASDNGGGVYVGYYSEFIMNGGVIGGNDADNGGGVYVEDGSYFELNGGSILGNYAEYYGGGVYVDGSSLFYMSGESLISENMAYDEGGGVFVVGGNDNYGGGIGGIGGIEIGIVDIVRGLDGEPTDGGDDEPDDDEPEGLPARVLVSGGTISGNGTVYGGGGGVYVGAPYNYYYGYYGVLSLRGAEENIGIEVFDFVLDGGEISGNSAGLDAYDSYYYSNGGGLYLGYGVSAEMRGGAISANSATCGGGVYLDSYSCFLMHGGEITDNAASYDAGGIAYWNSSSFLAMSGDVRVTGNYVKSGDGMLRLEKSPSEQLIVDDKEPAGEEDDALVYHQPSDVFLYSMPIVIDGPLAETARIGVYMYEYFLYNDYDMPITMYLEGNGDQSNFISNLDYYAVTLVEYEDSYEAMLVPGLPVLLFNSPDDLVALIDTMRYNGGSFYDYHVFYSAFAVAPGDPITEPEDPEREGAAFLGWYPAYIDFDEYDFDIGDEPFDFTAELTEDDIFEEGIALVAMWETGWGLLQEEIDAIAESESMTGTIVLDRDYFAYIADKELVIPAGVTVTLDLNGHVLDLGRYDEHGFKVSGNDSVFEVYGALTIEDSSEEGAGEIRGANGAGIYVGNNYHYIIGVPVELPPMVDDGSGDGSGSGSLIIIGEPGSGDGSGMVPFVPVIDVPSYEEPPFPASLTLNGGTITCNGNGGVYADYGATFTMNGGAITGNSKEYYGGGVCVDDGSEFVMNGGVISGNESEYSGGGVAAVYGATFTMNGGEITCNETDYCGGGVYVDQYSVFNMTDGLIGKNYAGTSGGGVHVCAGYNGIGGMMLMRDGAGEGEDLGEEEELPFEFRTAFTMDGGEISDNAAYYSGGGGVCVSLGDYYYYYEEEEEDDIPQYDVPAFVMNDGTISGNIADNEGDYYGTGGGVYLSYGASMEMNGGEISANSAIAGGGVYLECGSTFAMKGGEITDNCASYEAGGVAYWNEDSIFSVSGDVRILDNYVECGMYAPVLEKRGGDVQIVIDDDVSKEFDDEPADREPSNVYVAWMPIVIDGPLAETARIGVNTYYYGFYYSDYLILTDGLEGNGGRENFVCDVPYMAVTLMDEYYDLETETWLPMETVEAALVRGIPVAFYHSTDTLKAYYEAIGQGDYPDDYLNYYDLTSVACGDTILQPADPEREGYAFVGWYAVYMDYESETPAYTIDEEPFDFTTAITEEDLTDDAFLLVAVWEQITFEITEQPEDLTVVEGAAATFAVAAEGEEGAELSYQWYVKKTADGAWAEVKGDVAKQAVYSFTAQMRHNGYQYKCLVTDGEFEIWSDEVTLTVTVAPPALEITAQSGDVTVAEGETATFSVEIDGENLLYQWYVKKTADGDWAEVKSDAAKQASYSLTAALRHNGYQYKCHVTDGTLETWSEPVTLTVTEAAPAAEITGQSGDVTVMEGETATFSVETVGENLSYQWYVKKTADGEFAAVKSDAAKQAVYSLTAQLRHNGYQYKCLVTDGEIELWTEPVTLTVGSPVPALEITGQPSDQIVTEGETVTFAVEAEGDGELSYQWYVKKTADGDYAAVKSDAAKQAAYSFTAQLRHNGYQYKCLVTDGENELWTDEVTLTVGESLAALAIVSQPVDVAVTEGETATFAVVAEGDGELSYQWYVKKTADGDWTVIKSGAKQAVYSLSALLRHNGYQYKCLVSDGENEVWSDEVTLTVGTPTPVLLITSQPVDQNVTEGETAIFAVEAEGEGTLSYQWFVKKTADGDWAAIKSGAKQATYSLTALLRHNGYQYKCLVSDGDNEVWSDEVTLTVAEAAAELTITTQPVDVTVAEGETAIFAVEAEGDGELSYQWYVKKTADGDWAVIKSGAKQATYSLTTQMRHNGYQYKCLVTDGENEVWSDEVTLTVTELVATLEITTQPVDLVGEIGETVTFTVAASGGEGALSYQWYVKKTADGGWSAISSASAKTASYSLTLQARHNGYQYKCLVTDGETAVESDVVTLTVGEPVAALAITSQPTDQSVAVGTTATFAVAAEGDGALSYQWYVKKTADGDWAEVKSDAGKVASYTLSVLMKHNGYQYKCLVSDSVGQVWSDVATLTVG